MYRRILATLISVLAIAAFAAGCGDDESSGDSGDSGATVTKAEFVKDSETMCKRIRKDVQKELQELVDANKKSQPAEVETKLVTEIVVPTLQKELAEFEEIGTPEGEEEAWDEIVVEYEKTIENAEADPGGFSAAGDPFLEVDQKLKNFGLEACRH